PRLFVHMAVGIVLFFVGGVLATDQVGQRGADAQAKDTEIPVPQDRAKQEKLRQARLDYYTNTTAGAYDKVGKKSPRWDAAARRALEALAAHWSAPHSILLMDKWITVAEACDEALKAGCDDPFIRYLAEHQAYRFQN